jgi:cytidyltransferase-like protein
MGNVTTGLIAAGQLGLVDAALVRELEALGKKTGRLGVSVIKALYEPLLPREHLERFLSALECIQWIVPHDAVSSDTEPAASVLAVVHRLPETALQEYTVARLLKQIDGSTEEGTARRPKYCDVQELLERYGGSPQGRTRQLAVVSGTFDVIHLGHLCLMEQARALGDVLIVALQSTHSIRQQPKNARGDLPIYSETDRLAVVGALTCVDHVFLLDDLDGRQALARLRPNLFVKHQRDRERAIVAAEARIVERGGGAVRFLRHPDWGYASGDIIRGIRAQAAGMLPS